MLSKLLSRWYAPRHEIEWRDRRIEALERENVKLVGLVEIAFQQTKAALEGQTGSGELLKALSEALAGKVEGRKLN